MTRKQRTERSRTIADVTIPVGSEVTRIPFSRIQKHDYVSVVVSHDKDATSEWTMPVEDAVKLGIIPADFSAWPEKQKEPKESTDEATEDYAEQVPESFA